MKKLEEKRKKWIESVHRRIRRWRQRAKFFSVQLELFPQAREWGGGKAR